MFRDKSISTAQYTNKINIELYCNIDGTDHNVPLELCHDVTIEDLKLWILQHFNIMPPEQLIEGWKSLPKSDSDLLSLCCHLESENFLVVYKKEFDHITNSVHGEVPDISDYHAALHVSEFLSCGEIQFEAISLKEAVSKCCAQHKILILFLYNEGDDFSLRFLNYIRKNIETIRDRFCLIGWDVLNNLHTDALVQAVKEFEIFSDLATSIERRDGSAFALFPDEQSMVLFNRYGVQTSEEEFLLSIEILVKELDSKMGKIADSENKLDSQPSAEECLQSLLNSMVDSDYRSFEQSEHDHLKKQIAYALFGVPTEESQEDKETNEETNNECLEGYNEKQKKEILHIYNKITSECNTFSKWKDHVTIQFLFFCIEALPSKSGKDEGVPDLAFSQLPLFVLRKCKKACDKEPCRVFIDSTGRVYTSWTNFIKEVKLPKCEMVLPLGGRWKQNEDGKIKLERHRSAACDIGEQIRQGVDIAASLAGLGSAGVGVAAAVPALALAPPVLIGAAVVGASVGIYSVVRSGLRVFDRHIHKEPMGLDNPEARGDYLNVAAGVFGIITPGANFAVSKMVSKGMNIGTVTRGTFNALSVVNVATGGVALANSTYTTIDRFLSEGEKPTAFELLQLSSSILFFTHSVYNFRTANTIIEETQASALTKHEESLRSNRHKRTFNKMVKQTIKENGGNVQKGTAEVIKTLRTFGNNKDEIFATLTRNNKRMNKQGVKFSANDGNICLNGVPIDIGQFGKMDNTATVQFLNTLPGQPQEISQIEVNAYSGKFNTANIKMQASDITRIVLGFVLNTQLSVKEKFIEIASYIFQELTSKYSWIFDMFNDVFTPSTTIREIVNATKVFVRDLINQMEQEYQDWCGNGKKKDSLFTYLPTDTPERISQIYNIVTEDFFRGGIPYQNILNRLLGFSITWLVEKCVEKVKDDERREQRNKSGKPAQQIKCADCGGYYYAGHKS